MGKNSGLHLWRDGIRILKSKIYLEARIYNNLGSNKDNNNSLCSILIITLMLDYILTVFVRIKMNPPMLIPLEDRILDIVVK